ncbi:oxidoreductase [Paenibacillus selenitireducens]|uniref:Oxidoreductase n=1 Tax=Paenibacillus selenitireducens TaxID=1324314 RepID=A0A1T2XJQ0_9BACL|nr:SDR family oxidoreductase [Paenibacillus selenitireducens]OPA80084.1 oxidoreductase [Paenibacillus selenitireducens]
MFTFQDKIILITGASSGIGALMAQKLADRGAIPILTARSVDKLQELQSRIQGTSRIIPMDVTNENQVNAAVSAVIQEYGRIDILINNAGYGVFETFLDTSISEFDTMMDVNYMGIVRCTKAVLPHMVAAGQGHIVNIASLAGKIGSAKSSSYNATKHAVLGLTNALRQEMYGTGIYVTAINPGPIDTPFFEKADPSGQYVQNVKMFLLTPDQVVNSMMRAIEKRKAEVNLPFAAAAGIKLYQIFPRLADKFAYKLINKK